RSAARFADFVSASEGSEKSQICDATPSQRARIPSRNASVGGATAASNRAAIAAVMKPLTTGFLPPFLDAAPYEPCVLHTGAQTSVLPSGSSTQAPWNACSSNVKEQAAFA